MLAFFDLEGAEMWARFFSGYYDEDVATPNDPPACEGEATYSTLDELIGAETY
jgi:hypothetical protein